MKSLDILDQVLEFHKTFEIPVERKPVIPSESRCMLRISLLREELQELEEAIGEKNIRTVADGFCDLQYVLAGAILEFGIADKFAQLFYEVHRSNMTKVCSSERDARETVRYYMENEQTESYYKKSGRRYLIYRASDRKILKSVNYSPPRLSEILDA